MPPAAKKAKTGAKITGVSVRDIRFPTSLEAHGSDAMHKDPDYSAAYIVITTDAGDGHEGHGLAFTLGRGTEVIVAAVNSLSRLMIGVELDYIYNNFGKYWRELCSEGQLRWIGPEKGAIHLANGAAVNALWDLWGKREGKPVWRLLCDMTPEQIVSCIDFRWISDALKPEEALEILKKNKATVPDRIAEMEKDGFPAYTTSAGWLGYSDDRIRKLCQEGLAKGWSNFKIKVGADIEDDKRRCKIIRDEIGYDRKLMMDANQRWDVEPAIEFMKQLAEFKPTWIEEPTSPDDVLGHATIAKALKPYGIGVATGEMCQNRVVFKQLMQAEAISFCQIDSCRIGGVNEILSVLLMAKKFGIPVCPHAGGVGLCEHVQHLSIFDYICVSGTLENRVLEYVDHLHEHFLEPVVMKNGHYMPPKKPGYSIQMHEKTLTDYEFPNGPAWVQLRKEGKVPSE
eukprot:m.339730 g.339730  ORF g.339730 m.339730 type:complete len:455 (-) comp18940_c0_seq1:108-1472(-)